MIQIKNRFTDEIIHEGDFDNIRECVEDAVKKGISLTWADLSDVNLNDTNLINANLTNAKMPPKPVVLPPGLHDPDFVYRLGKTHLPDRFDPDERHNCLPGLHFFMTFEEAAEW